LRRVEALPPVTVTAVDVNTGLVPVDARGGRRRNGQPGPLAQAADSIRVAPAPVRAVGHGVTVNVRVAPLQLHVLPPDEENVNGPDQDVKSVPEQPTSVAAPAEAAEQSTDASAELSMNHSFVVGLH